MIYRTSVSKFRSFKQCSDPSRIFFRGRLKQKTGYCFGLLEPMVFSPSWIKTSDALSAYKLHSPTKANFLFCFVIEVDKQFNVVNSFSVCFSPLFTNRIQQVYLTSWRSLAMAPTVKSTRYVTIIGQWLWSVYSFTLFLASRWIFMNAAKYCTF